MNALNSAQWMARIHEQHDISVFLAKLNFLLGYNLNKTHVNASLRSEIKLLDSYLDLQQMRMDFNVSKSIEEGDYLDSHCARMILQPIAENSLTHNLDEFGNIWISIQRTEANRVEIQIRDDGVGFDSGSFRLEMSDSEGNTNRPDIGLRYVYAVLQDFYGEDALMKIESQIGKGTAVYINLPIINSD